MPFEEDGWNYRVFQEAYNAAREKHTGKGDPFNQAIAAEWADAADKLAILDMEAAQCASDHQWRLRLTIAILAGLLVFGIFSCIGWEVYKARRWREKIIEIFRLPEDASTLAIWREVFACITIRVFQFILVLVQALVSAIWWAGTPLRNFGRYLFELFAEYVLFPSLEFVDPFLHRVETWYNDSMRSIRNYQEWDFSQACLHYWTRTCKIFSTRNLFIAWVIVVGGFGITQFVLAASAWETPLLYFRAWKMWLEPIPPELLRPKSAPFTHSQQHQRPVWRDVPTARVIGMEVPIVVPAPTVGMGKWERGIGSPLKTIIAGNDLVYCSKCKQWHCCELPY